jgi:ubiquilin
MGARAAAAAPVANPEEAYATQLQQLRDMGFYDQQENIAALQATGGNVNSAVERLLSP